MSLSESYFYRKSRNDALQPVSNFDFIPQGIKCAQCDMIFLEDQISEHLNSHINPKFLTPHPESSGAKKLRGVVLTEDTESFSSDIPSLQLDNFPHPDPIKKEVYAPSRVGANQSHSNIPSSQAAPINSRADHRDVVSSVLGVIHKDQTDTETIKQTISLESDKVSSLNLLDNQNNLTMYSNRKGHHESRHSIAHTSKKQRPPEDEDPQALQYRIEKSDAGRVMTTSILNCGPSGMVSQTDDPNIVTVNFNKHGAQGSMSKIDTHSNMKGRDRIQNLHTPTNSLPWNNPFNTPQKTPLKNETPTHHGTIVNSYSRFNTEFECPDCHGFYCRYCQSTIPPQYRPANIGQVDERVVSFYRQNVYKKECEVCDDRHDLSMSRMSRAEQNFHPKHSRAEK